MKITATVEFQLLHISEVGNVREKKVKKGGLVGSRPVEVRSEVPPQVDIEVFDVASYVGSGRCQVFDNLRTVPFMNAEFRKEVAPGSGDPSTANESAVCKGPLFQAQILNHLIGEFTWKTRVGCHSCREESGPFSNIFSGNAPGYQLVPVERSSRAGRVSHIWVT